MELSLIARARKPAPLAWTQAFNTALGADHRSSRSFQSVATCALRQGGPEVLDKEERIDSTSIQSFETSRWHQSEAVFQGADDPLWEQLSLVVRVLYSLGLYAGLAFAGQSICNLIGTDCWGGLEFSLEVALTGLGYAVPPMLTLLFLQDDEIVKVWPPARAMRDVEDAEIMEYFEGMGWQFLPVVMAGALSEELFFRVAVQGGLAHVIQASTANFSSTPQGLSSLTAIVPSFAPSAQLFAVVISSALTGSMYYVITAPRDPTYIFAPAAQSRKALRDVKKRFRVWNERRELRKIYSPLVESLLALYLGLEWVQTSNILAPMITHLVYSNVIVGNGLMRIHYQRRKLRQRVARVLTKTK